MFKAIFSNISNTIKGTNRFTEARIMSLLHNVDVPFEKATFGLGCFWGVETLFGGKTGVLRTRVGYGGGKAPNPTYKNIQDHTEITQVDFDPKIVSYEELLDMFWKNHDPTFKTKTQYCSLILYHSPEQKSLAEKTRDEVKKTSKDEVLTRIEPFEIFYDAEGYHQKYHLQEHASLLPTLGFQKDDERLKTSHLAAKVNAYLVGMSTVEQFDTEVTSLGVDEETTKYIREYNVKNQGRGMTC
uniref:peptide-methionine (S)-S-oxide reductase n=2 Tax=Homalodisca liturata TaxID=320908 RepID=A0A1B6IBP0_9HEMI